VRNRHTVTQKQTNSHTVRNRHTHRHIQTHSHTETDSHTVRSRHTHRHNTDPDKHRNRHTVTQ